MIFLAVGTQKFPFDRLIAAVDALAGEYGVDVFGQIGNASHVPQNFRFERYLNKQDYSEKIEQCDMVITHSGVGTIIQAVSTGKTVIVMPRLAVYGEHVDDHQVQIAEAFGENGLILVCEQSEDLPSVYEKAKNTRPKEYKSCRNVVIQTVEDFLNGLEKR